MATEQNPYIGPRTFQRNERHLFFGREREARDLISLVASERLVVFYAQSGAGKSSIVNTRLIPNLEEKEYEVLPVGRVSGDSNEGLDINNIYIYNLLRSLEQHDIDPSLFAKLTLAQFLCQLNYDDKGFFYDPALSDMVLAGEDETVIRRALIIDQFEELFSTHPEAWEKREDFFAQVAQAMQDDPHLWVVLVMREDYIAALDPYAHLVSNGLRVRYYMQRLGREAALKAVKSPVAEIRPYGEGVAEKLIDDLCSIKVQQPDGTLDVQPGQYVEPVQMQVVCYGLWDNLSPDGTQITEQDLQAVGDVNQSLGKYYDRRVAEVAKTKNVRERMIREWFEKKLITAGGIRNMVLQEREPQPGELGDDVIQALQSDLVRGEKRGGATWYELTHDRLVEPILERNKIWFSENLSPLQRQAALWEDQHHNESWLLREQALAEVEEWARDHQDELTDIEVEFLDVCRAAEVERLEKQNREDERKELEATKKLMDEQARSAQLARRLTAIAVFLMVIAIVASITAGVQRNEAVKSASAASTSESLAIANSEKADDQAAASLSGQAAAYALNFLDTQPDLAILLSLESDRIRSDLHTRNALLTTLQKTSQIERFMDPSIQAEEAQFSPDGNILVLRNRNGVTLWDAKSLQPMTSPINEHFSQVDSLAISRDGKVMASGSCSELGQGTCSKSEIVLWDAENGIPFPVSLTGHRDYVFTVAFSPDGNILASGSNDNTIILWNISDRNDPYKLAVLTEHAGPIWSVAFSPDGKFLASASDDQTVRLWDVDTGLQIGEPLTGHASGVYFVTFSPNGKTLASSDSEGDIILWDVSKQKKIGNAMEDHSDGVWYMAFSPDGKTLASGSVDDTVRLWDVAKHKQIGEPLTGHSSTVFCVAFSPDGKTVASSDGNGAIILWDVEKRQPYGEPLSGHKSSIYNMAFSGDLLISGSLDSTIIYWDVKDPDNVKMSREPLRGHLGRPTAVQFNSTSSLLASIGDDRTILLDVDSKTVIGSGSLLSTNGNDNIVAYQLNDRSHDELITYIQDANSGEEIISVRSSENLLFSPDGKFLLYQIPTEDEVPAYHLWDLAQKKEITVASRNVPSFSQDSKIIILETIESTDEQPIFELWDLTVDITSLISSNSLARIPGQFLSIDPKHTRVIYGVPTPNEDNEDNGNLTIHDWNIADAKEVSGLSESPKLYLGSSKDGNWLVFKTIDENGIERLNVLNVATGEISENLTEGSGFLRLSDDGRILFYSSFVFGREYVNVLDIETQQPILPEMPGQMPNNNQVYKAGNIVAYQVIENTEQESRSNLAFINSSNATQVGNVVSQGSYLGQTMDGELLIYQSIVNKKPMINVMDTETGSLLSEAIPGNFLAISPDGKTLVFRNENNSIILWNTLRTWPLGEPVIGAPDKVNGAALSPDGQKLVWIGKDGITLQDAKTGTVIDGPFNGHFGNVTSVEFRSDNKTLLAGSEGGIVNIWNFVSSIQEGKTIELAPNNYIQLAKDGAILVSVDTDNATTTLWDVATQQQIGDPIAGGNAVLNPNGTILAVGNSATNTTTLWDLTTNQSIGSALSGNQISFSSRGNTLAIGNDSNNQTIIWNLETMQEVRKLPGFYGSFNQDGTVFASYDSNDNTTLWGVASFTKFGKVYPGLGTLSPNGNFLAFQGSEEINLWDVSDPHHPKEYHTFKRSDSEGPYTGVMFSPSGNLLAVYRNASEGTEDSVSIFDLNAERPEQVNLRPILQSRFTFDKNADRVAYVEDQNVVIWDRAAQPQSNAPIKTYLGLISGVTFNGMGDQLAIFGNRGIVVWDITANQEIGERISGSAIPGTSVLISPNGKVMASQAADGIVLKNLDTKVGFHLETGEYTGSLTDRFSFYANSSRFIAIGSDGTLLTWDVSSKEAKIFDDRQQPLKGKTTVVSIFSPDGRYLAFDNYGRIRIWDIKGSQYYGGAGDFEENENPVSAMTFSSDGTLLAYSDGPKILLWNIVEKKKLGEFSTGLNNITRLSLIMNQSIPQYIITVDDTGTTQIWDWSTSTKIGLPIRGSLQIIGFNDSNQTVYYIDAAKRLIQWHWSLPVEAWMQLFCPLVQRNFTQDEWMRYFRDKPYPASNLTCPNYPIGQ